jgi:hypothetical protein
MTSLQRSEACNLLGEDLSNLLTQGTCHHKDAPMSSWNRMHSLVTSAQSQLHKAVDGDLQRLAITQRMIRMRVSSKVQVRTEVGDTHSISTYHYQTLWFKR